MASESSTGSSLLDHRAPGTRSAAPGRPASPSARDRRQASRTRRKELLVELRFWLGTGFGAAAWSAARRSGQPRLPTGRQLHEPDVRIRKTNVESE